MSVVDEIIDEVGIKVNRASVRIKELANQKLTTSVSECTYKKYLNIYISLKIRFNYLNAENFSLTDLSAKRRTDSLANLVKKYHDLMYEKPCFICATCVDRKKSWKS